MSLFEKVKNIRRNNLQEKRKFPGDESGAYKRVKTDIEAKNLIKKAGGSGDIGFTAPDRKTKVAKRTTRAIKQGTPDPFDIDTSKAAKQTDKDFGRPTKSQIKKLDKKPGGYRAPKGAFGPGITQGQANVKGLESKATFNTPYAEYDPIKQPRGVKLPKSFTDFERNLQDYKDRDVPGGPKKYKQTELKFSSKNTTKPSGSRYDPDIGMASSETPKTKVVKQSEVSKQAKDFTKNINQQRQTTTPSKSDVNRRAQNRIDTQQADAFKKTAAYKNIAQGTDAQGNYLTPEQRKKNFIKQTKQNKEPKNKTIRPRKDKNTFKTAGGDRVTTGRGRGVGSIKSVTMNKDAAQALRNPSKVNKTGSQIFNQNTIKGAKGPTSMKDVKLGTKSFKNMMPKLKKAATPAAKAFSKAGPVGKLAAAALGAGALIYGANQVRKAFAGAGKPKAPPAVKGSALRYTSGPKKGQKKYFDIKTMKRDYFTKSDFRDSKGNIDAGFGQPDRDEKLIKKLKSTK